MQKLSLIVVCCVIMLSSCDTCKVNPDLISNLIGPANNIILGEPVDWTYVVKSVEENSGECKILDAAASVGLILVDFFVNPSDTTSDTLTNQTDNIGKLHCGEEEEVVSNIVFANPGVYLIATTADNANTVAERDENNNKDNAEEVKGPRPDIFKDPSLAFTKKLENAAAIVLVGNKYKSAANIKSYNGKPVYYVAD